MCWRYIFSSKFSFDRDFNQLVISFQVALISSPWNKIPTSQFQRLFGIGCLFIFSYPGQLNSWHYQSLPDVTFDFTIATMTTITIRKNKSLFPVHFALLAMQLFVWALCSPSGIEPLTLVPACIALDHKTREDTMIVFFWDFKDYNDYSD